MKKKNIKIANYSLDSNSPPILLPEIGTFFNQKIENAIKMISELKIRKAKIIKGEILHDDKICLDTALRTKYFSNDKKKFIFEDYKKLIKRKVCKLEEYEKIFKFCKKKKLPFILSVYDFDGADFAKKLGASAIKVASSNIVHKPLIQYINKLKIPILLDTGHSSLFEIKRAFSWIKSKKVIIQHSPPSPKDSNYLNLSKNQNLNFLYTLEKKFGCLVGLSDHFPGPEMLYLASSMNAKILEKGFYLEKKNDQDFSHAAQITDFETIQETCTKIFYGKGNAILQKNRGKKDSRMGIIAKCNLKKGDTITKENITFAFPAVGIKVENIDKILNKRITKNIKINFPIRTQHFK